MKTMFPRTIIAVAAFGLMTGAAALHADEITDAIDEAVKAYKEKDYSGAATSLETAAQLVRQMRAAGLSEFLPPAPTGWEAKDAESSSAGGSMFGGVTSAQRQYVKTSGGGTVDVQYIADSPAMQGYMMMLNMPMMATADGGKLITIKRQKAIMKYKAGDQEGTITMVVAGQLIVLINGRKVSEADLRAIGDGIPFDKLIAAL